jgi:hypothetical protein
MKRTILSLILAGSTSAPISLPQERVGEPEKLGKVHFPVSCSPAAQQAFDRALAMLHSFWFPQALNAFGEVTNTDPNCAMGYWGVAMSRRTNPLVGAAPPPAALKDALQAIDRAEAIGAKTQRERDYIAAIGKYYRDAERLDFRTRVLAYEKAM